MSINKKTNVLLDQELVESAKKLTGTRFTKDVVDLALRRLVRNARRQRIDKSIEFRVR